MPPGCKVLNCIFYSCLLNWIFFSPSSNSVRWRSAWGEWCVWVRQKDIAVLLWQKLDFISERVFVAHKPGLLGRDGILSH